MGREVPGKKLNGGTINQQGSIRRHYLEDSISLLNEKNS